MSYVPAEDSHELRTTSTVRRALIETLPGAAATAACERLDKVAVVRCAGLRWSIRLRPIAMAQPTPMATAATRVPKLPSGTIRSMPSMLSVTLSGRAEHAATTGK
jgi:hypothetical protein